MNARIASSSAKPLQRLKNSSQVEDDILPQVLATSPKVYKSEKQRLPTVTEGRNNKKQYSTEEMELKMSGFHSLPLWVKEIN